MARIRIGNREVGPIRGLWPIGILQNFPASARLRWYAERFNYVEVNSTFYAIPNARTVERWCDETPGRFSFST
jgi:uncharacterized protein YecE (DUF72 family)